jgi:hypothetical protein
VFPDCLFSHFRPLARSAGAELRCMLDAGFWQQSPSAPEVEVHRCSALGLPSTPRAIVLPATPGHAAPMLPAHPDWRPGLSAAMATFLQCLS